MKKRKKQIKINGKKLVFSIFLLSAFFFVSAFTVGISGQAATVNFQITDNGLPLEGEKIRVVNYETAFKKISQGSYTAKDKQSLSWQNLSQTNPDGKQGIKLPNGMILNNGVTHSKDESLNIIRFLFTNSHIDLLQILNESSDFGGNASNVGASRNFTNTSGKSSLNAAKGATIFAFAKTNATLGVEDIKKDTNLKFDISNSDDRIRITSNLNEAQAGGKRQFSVEYGQEITYQIHIDKGYFSSASGSQSLVIRPSSNLQIDSLSLPSQKVELVDDTVNPSSYLLPDNDGNPQVMTPANQKDILDSLGQALLKKSLNSYSLQLPAIDESEDLTITVQAHVVPIIDISRKFIVNGQQEEHTISINANTSPGVNFNLSATADNGTESISAESPSVNTSGVNFAMTNNSGDKLLTGATYVLGKEIEGKKYFYDGQNWQAESDSFKKENAEILTGGKQYLIGTNINSPISTDSSRFGMTGEEASRINQSLIQLRGLAQGKYFLEQVHPTDGYPAKKEPIDFEVYSRTEITTNGNALVRNSIAYANNPAFDVNGKIPDYAADSNEYNVLKANSSNQVNFNWRLKILLPISILVLVMLVIGILLIKIL